MVCNGHGSDGRRMPGSLDSAREPLRAGGIAQGAFSIRQLEAGNPGLFSLSAYSHLQWVCSNSNNNRTKTMMRQAYGYRNFHNLRLRILMERGG